MEKLTYETIIARFIEMAENNEGIRAAVIVGSRARTEVPADEYSDLDLVAIVENPSVFLDDTDWLGKIGKHYLTFLENTAVGGGKERRVLFEEGLDVDFAFFPVSALPELEQDPEPLGVFAKGVRVLFDKDGTITTLIRQAPQKLPAPQMRGSEELGNVIHDFWYHAVLAAKKIRRGELLDAKSIGDSYMKHLLMELVRTQSRLNHGPAFDTWHGNRFFEKWADPETMVAYKNLYGVYVEEDVWRALHNTMGFFRETAKDVCVKMNLHYPEEGDAYAAGLVESLYSQEQRPV
ncbi:aminoglycoside 6-adenylyltransferase [Bacillus infantis]|uniref:aminoglycoside 6-adenylyltransferase n=1 Tax=Bacillus infantis TaxID=324767 RepID=UPI003CF9ED16